MSQQDIQNNLWQQRGNLQVKAELCNVLYERELQRLSTETTISVDELKKAIKSLPFYINRAAESICNTYSPLDLDSSNASWLSRQSPHTLSSKHNDSATRLFYEKNAKMVLIVPIATQVFGIEQVVLDSIDEIDALNGRLHCNQNGWFYMSGEYLDNKTSTTKVLLKPSKVTMSAACCGHQWKNNHKFSGRALSLRELLLATRINWQNFGKIIAPKR